MVNANTPPTKNNQNALFSDILLTQHHVVALRSFILDARSSAAVYFQCQVLSVSGPWDLLDIPQFREKLLRFCKASAMFDSTQTVHLQALSQQLKRFLLQRVQLFIEEAASDPVLLNYTADATPIKLATRHVRSQASLPGVLRQGKSLLEFLVQNSFYTRLGTDGRPVRTLLLVDPISLSAGKKAMHQYSAVQRCIYHLKHLGHQGISITFYCFDRLVSGPLGRLLEAHHDLSEFDHTAQARAQGVQFARLTDWHVTVSCAIHDAHNAAKWGCLGATGRGPLLKSLHIGIESLRNSTDPLVAHLHGFLTKHLCFVPPLPAEDLECWRMVWLALGVSPVWTDVLLELELHWSVQDSLLYVSSAHKHEPDTLDQISTAMLALCRFITFTESRWLSVGASSRALIAASLVGMLGVAELCRQDPAVSDYYLSGSQGLNFEVLRFALISALSTYPTDTVIVMLMEDDRLLLRADELWSNMQDELLYLRQLPMGVWSLMHAGISQQDEAACLRDAVLDAATISVAYFQNRTLAVLERPIWRLARGDLNLCLEKLAALPTAPADHILGKVWHLLRLGTHMQLTPKPRLGT